MTLQNLLAIKRLLAHAPDGAAIRKLLEAARRNLDDVRIEQISTDNRSNVCCWAMHEPPPAAQPG